MKEIKFFRCLHCGNIVMKLVDSGVVPMCCGQPMQELQANTTDAAFEKHIPVIERNGNIVQVTIGEALHPMTEEHYIQWIYLQTNLGGQIRYLEPNQEPKAQFSVNEDCKIVAVYAYCNLHSLWKKEICE